MWVTGVVGFVLGAAADEWIRYWLGGDRDL
jgi:hypothetical protein